MRRSNSTPDLQAICSFWQKVLKLQDWRITINYERFHKMRDKAGGLVWGDVRTVPTCKRAYIHVLHPGDNEGTTEQDVEETIVHELLHVHINEVLRNKEDEIEEERAINALAEAYVTLRRGGKGTYENRIHKNRRRS